jgi:arsenate reductase (thioredoxin)
MSQPAKVLFVCIGNSCRSQMAEALARHSARDVIEAASAGIVPLGVVQSSTEAVLRERGVSSAGQFSKGLGEIERFRPDLIINMSGYAGRGRFGDYAFEDWSVEDPYGDDLATYRRICDDIEARVADLAARLRAKIKNNAPA